MVYMLGIKVVIGAKHRPASLQFWLKVLEALQSRPPPTHPLLSAPYVWDLISPSIRSSKSSSLLRDFFLNKSSGTWRALRALPIPFRNLEFLHSKAIAQCEQAAFTMMGQVPGTLLAGSTGIPLLEGCLNFVGVLLIRVPQDVRLQPVRGDPDLFNGQPTPRDEIVAEIGVVLQSRQEGSMHAMSVC